MAVEYSFEAPASIPSGQVGLRLDNEGAEVHEALLLRIDDGVDLSIEELLELPEEEADSMVEFAGATLAPPGESSAFVTELQPGRYALLCFLPVGTTSLDQLFQESESESGPPHAFEGMFAELTVE